MPDSTVRVHHLATVSNTFTGQYVEVTCTEAHTFVAAETILSQTFGGQITISRQPEFMPSPVVIHVRASPAVKGPNRAELLYVVYWTALRWLMGRGWEPFAVDADGAYHLRKAEPVA